MANEFKVGINVSSDGTLAQVEKEAKAVNKQLKDMATNSTAASAALKAGGTAGSKKAAYKAEEMDNTGYRNLRGVAEATGASSRDFARQAQGLGGLVHVYATFAANLFAVSAAFTALKNAADTTNMIKGLDQLGAASGRNLGQLSKSVAALSDGAVSLREAMTATAQATSAGMSNKNLERLTVVAKNASQALGLNMPDALSRLSRGITKIEPELLDELGLFVKVDEASANYARSVGKTTASITDFEKRQAFANEALRQGEEKFNAINMVANPYSKLSASISNLAQSALELVNKGLGPLMNILSQSPSALGLALAGIAGILLKQAIPAIGQYRRNAKLLADEAHENVIRMVKDQQAAHLKIDMETAKNAEARFKLEEKTQKRISDLQSARFNQEILGKDLRGTLKKSTFDLTAADTAALKTKAEALIASDNDVYARQGKKLQAHLSDLDKLRKDSALYAEKAVEESVKNSGKWYSYERMLAENAAKATQSSEKRNVLARVADTAAILGPTAGIKQLRAEVALLDASKAAKSFIFLQGALSTVATAAGTAIGAFSGWIAIIGFVVSGLSALASWMSKTAKETELTKLAIEALDSSVQNVNRTTEALNLKGMVEQMSIDAIQARATAFGELGDSIALASKRAYAELDKMGTIDVGTNFIKGLWDGDVQATLNKSTADAVTAAFTVLERGPAADAVRESIKKTLNIDKIDTKSIEKAFEGMSEAAKKSSIESLARDLKAAGDAARVTAARGTELKQSFAEATKQLQDLRNSFIAQDNVSKFGVNVMMMAAKIDAALKDPLQTLNTMVAVVKDSNSLSFFDPATATQLIALKGKVDDLNNSFISANKAVKDTDDKIKELNDEKGIGFAWTREGVARVREIRQELEGLKGTQEVKAKLLLEVDAEVQALQNDFRDAIGKQFVYGAQVISAKLSEEWAKAGSIIGATIAGLLGDTKVGIEARAKYEKEALQAQITGINSQLLLIKSNEKLAIEIEQAALDRKKENADPRDLRITTAQQEIDYRRQRLEAPVTQGTSTSVAKDMAAGVAGARESFKYVQQAEAAYAQIAQISASMGAVSIKASVDKIKLESKYQQERLDNESSSLKNQEAGLALLGSVAGTSVGIINSQKQALELDLARYDAKKKAFEIETQIKVLEDLKSKTKGPEKAGIDLEITRLGLVKEVAAARSQELITNLKNKQALETANAEYSVKSNMLDVYRTLGGISEQDYEKSKLKLLNDKEILDTQVKIDQLRQNAKSQVSMAEEKISVAETKLQDPSTSPEETKVLNALIEEQVSLIDSTAVKTSEVVSQIKAQSAAQLETNAALTQQKVIMAEIKSVTESLSAVFGELGTSIGGVVSALTSYNTGSAAMTARHEDSLKKFTKDDDNYTKQVAQNTKEREKYDVNSYANMAGSAKKMFKEKTTAHKVFATVEKTMHLVKLAMFAKEAAMEVWAAGVSIASSIQKSMAKSAEAGVDGIAAVVKAIASVPFPLNLAAGAATAAVVAALLGQIGGKKPSSAGFGMNSEQRQETQGTGYTYDSQGNKVETGGGVFGDAGAKSQSIANSLEIIKNNSIVGLDYDNRMLRAMQSVASAITGVATSLYSVPGLRSGGTFGTMSGSVSATGDIQNAFTDIGNTLTLGLGGGLIGGLAGSMFGGGTSMTASIESAGIQLSGTFKEVMDDVSGSILQYKDILKQYHEDGGWFGSDSDWTERSRETQALTNSINTAISDVFKQSFEMFTEISKVAGLSTDNVTKAFNTMSASISIDLKGLTGNEILEELNAVFSSQLDSVAANLFSTFAYFKKFGEGYLETVVRVVDGNNKVDQALRSLGSTFDVTYNSAYMLSKYDVSEGLIKAAGGLQEFMDQAGFFVSNFLTESQALEPITKSVNAELTRLGIGIDNSREDYVKLVQGLDLSSESGRALYQSLMDLAPGLDMVLKAEEKILSEREGLQDKLDKMNKTSNELRTLELAKLDASNRAIQLQIWALEDQQTAAKALQTSLANVTKTIKTQIQSLNDYKLALQTGSGSTLTTSQQYSASKSEIQRLQSIIASTPTTQEEVDTRNSAISKLSSSTDKWLSLSRELFASGAQYTSDYNTVIGIVDSVSGALDSQLSDAEAQLTALETANTYLSTIASSSLSTVQLLSNYTATGAAALPSFAVGTNYVPNDMVANIHKGERIIPATDNVTLMSTLSSSNNNNREMVIEIRNLNQKIERLERAVADGAIMNAQATDRNTEQLSEVITDNSGKAIQANRLQNKASIK